MTLMPLKFTPKGNARVQIGVSWDIGSGTVKKGLIFKTEEHVRMTYDLDIFCCFYDAAKNLLGSVTPENANLVGAKGQIYHSGDNKTGRISGDDEFISVNMAELPEAIASIVFVILCNGKDVSFRSIDGVHARIADGASDETQFLIDASPLPGSHKDGFVFAALIRDPAQPQGWAIKNISAFHADADITDWAETLKSYLP